MIRLFDVWCLLPQRMALHEPTATVVVADLHLGYSAVRQRQGDAIPHRSVADELKPLIELARAIDIRRLVVAGDLFEGGFDSVIFQQFVDVLRNVRIALLGVVPGNHDRGIEAISSSAPLLVDGLELDGWRIVHGDQPCEEKKTIAGHWHPALKIRGRKVPCFLAQGERLILPAFSRDASGVDISKDVRWTDWTRYAIDDGKVIEANEKSRRLHYVPLGIRRSTF